MVWMSQLGTGRALRPLQLLQSRARGTAGARHGLGAATAAPGATPAPQGALPRAQGQLKELKEHFKLPSVAAELFRHGAGALPGKSKPPPRRATGWTWCQHPERDKAWPQSSSVTALLRRSQLCDCTPQELRGLKDLHSQKPLLIASKTCFKRPQSPEISHKKANPQRQHSQNRVPVGWVL